MASRFFFRRISRSLRAFLGACCLLLAGCTEEPPISLSPENRAEIDTLYARQVRPLRLELDSLCEAIFEDEVAAAVDSLLPIRRAEEARLRQRIPLQQ